MSFYRIFKVDEFPRLEIKLPYNHRIQWWNYSHIENRDPFVSGKKKSSHIWFPLCLLPVMSPTSLQK